MVACGCILTIWMAMCMAVAFGGDYQSLKGTSALDDLEAFLFPNRTAPSQLHRQLAISKVPWDKNNPVPCAQCTSMSVCKILDNLRVEETYYPKDPGRKETCNVIDSFAKRISREIFGNGRAFRDTPQCRDIVMQYLCLFYGSDNNMYRNYCYYQEDVKDPNSNEFLLAPRPPCRSFCVQVASVCANDPTFIQTCNRIACPPTEAACTPDPEIDGQVLATNLGCDVPYYRTPYNAATRSGANTLLVSVILSLAVYFAM